MSSHRGRRLAIASSAASLLLAPCAMAGESADAASIAAAPSTEPSRPVARIAAVVGAGIITTVELDRHMVPRESEIASLPEAEREAARERVRAQVLELLIQRRLVESEARRLLVTVAPDEVQTALNRVAENNGVTLERLQQLVLAEGYSWALYQEEVYAQLLQMRVVQMAIQSSYDPNETPQAREAALTKAIEAWLEEQRERTFVEVR